MLSGAAPRRLGRREQTTEKDRVEQCGNGRATPSTTMMKGRLLSGHSEILPNFPLCRGRSSTPALLQRGKIHQHETSSIPGDSKSNTASLPKNQPIVTRTSGLGNVNIDSLEFGLNDTNEDGQIIASCLTVRSRTPTQQQRQDALHHVPLSRSYLSRYKASISTPPPSTTVDFSSTSNLSIRDPFNLPPSPLIKSTRNTVPTNAVSNNTDVQRNTTGTLASEGSLLHEVDNTHLRRTGLTRLYSNKDVDMQNTESKDFDTLHIQKCVRLKCPSESATRSVAVRSGSFTRETPVNCRSGAGPLADVRLDQPVHMRILASRNRDVKETTNPPAQEQPTDQKAKVSKRYESYRTRFQVSQQVALNRSASVSESMNQIVNSHDGHKSIVPNGLPTRSQEDHSKYNRPMTKEINHGVPHVAPNIDRLVNLHSPNNVIRPNTPINRSRVAARMITPSTPTSLMPSQMRLQRTWTSHTDEVVPRVIRIPYGETMLDNTIQSGLTDIRDKTVKRRRRLPETPSPSIKIQLSCHIRGQTSENGIDIGHESLFQMRREYPTARMNMESESSSLSSVSAECLPDELSDGQDKTSGISNSCQSKEGSNESNNKLIDMDDRILSWLWDCEQTTEFMSLPEHLPNIGVSL